MVLRTVQKYPVSPVARKSLALPPLKELATEVFGTCREEGGVLHAQFGALKDLKIGIEGKDLLIETVMDPSVSPEAQQDTIHRYYAFLERATGYTAKQRAKKLQEAAKKGKPEG